MGLVDIVTVSHKGRFSLVIKCGCLFSVYGIVLYRLVGLRNGESGP